MVRLTLVLLVMSAAVAVAALGARGAERASATHSQFVVYSDGPSPTSIPRLRVLNVDTRGSHALVPTRFAHNGSWSPTGTRVVFEDYGTRAGNGPQLSVLAVQSGRVRRITHSVALDESPAWSPDGRHIVFSRAPLSGPDDGLWLMNAAGGGERHLTYNTLGDVCASWSPDGRRIAFARTRNATGVRDLWLMRAGGGGQHRLIAGASCASWSPDGSQLAFGKLTGRTIPGCGCGATDLYVANEKGWDRHLLVRNGGDATWSPDGTRLVFVRWEGSRTRLWTVGADGTGLRRLTRGVHSQRAPAWQP